MASQIIDLKQLYDIDYNQWLEETIQQLSNRQLQTLDYEYLIEELEATSTLTYYAKHNIIWLCSSLFIELI